MPSAIFSAYVKMLPRIEAERSLGRISETAAGSGTMAENDQKEFRRSLQQDAQMRRERAVKATSADLAGMGIVVGDE